MQDFEANRDKQSNERAIENITQEAASYLVLFRHSCTVLSMKSNDWNSECLSLNIERKEHRKHCVGQK
jgi:hypothetical protein